MGLFHFKKQKEKEQIPMERPKRSPMKFQSYRDKDGTEYIDVEFHEEDGRRALGQDYDTTRLMIKRYSSRLPNGTMIEEAKISWRHNYDVIFLDENGREVRITPDMEEIRLKIDFEKLYQDLAYQEELMRGLLTKQRVIRYLNQGLEEEPEHPSGNYVGEVRLREERDEQGNIVKRYYGKVFSSSIGKVVHNLPDQVARREAQKQKAQKDAIAEQKRRQMQKLQGEIEELYR